MKINLTVNGVKKNFEVQPQEYLVEVLRREGYLGVKKRM